MNSRNTASRPPRAYRALVIATGLAGSLAATHPLHAQTLSDPMRPPVTATAPARSPAADQAAAEAPRLALQSILITTDRRHAWIDDRQVQVGDRVGPQRVARIEETAVTLIDPAGKRTVLGLHPDVIRATPATPVGGTR